MHSKHQRAIQQVSSKLDKSFMMSISANEPESMPLKRIESTDSEGEAWSPTQQACIHHEETHSVMCPNIGQINVFQQGVRSAKEVVIMTVHDLGCDHTMYTDFVGHPKMQPIRSRTVWLHVEIPGQGLEAEDLPNDYQFPSMQQIGEDLVVVLDQLKVSEVVCLGEGAGANILARFAMAHISRVLGVCLLHTTGTTAGFFESLKDRFMAWKLDQTRMNQSAEQYLILHRFGATKFSKASDNDELRNTVECYKESLREKVNYKNLCKFVDSFLKRTSINETIKKLNCPVLLVCGQFSVFNETTRILHQAITKVIDDKTRVEFMEVAEVANVLEEKPDKLAECFQYFLQGLGLVSSVPMQNVQKLLRSRTMSMEEYDKPMKERKGSLSIGGGGGSVSSSPGSPLSSSPPSTLCPITQGEVLEVV